jgi:nucleoside-diphosphate-sugar epimerase
MLGSPASWSLSSSVPIDYALRGWNLQVHGRGMSARDFVEVSDVANVVLNYVRQPVSNRINVATGITHVDGVVVIIERKLERELGVAHVPIDWLETRIEFDVTKLRLGNPGFVTTSLEECGSNYIDALRSSEPS